MLRIGICDDNREDIARIRELFGLDLDSFSTAHQILLSCQMIRLLQD